MSLRFSVTVVEAGTEKVPVGAPIATIVHTEEDIALYRAAQETLGKTCHHHLSIHLYSVRT